MRRWKGKHHKRRMITAKPVFKGVRWMRKVNFNRTIRVHGLGRKAFIEYPLSYHRLARLGWPKKFFKYNRRACQVQAGQLEMF